jgi:hypothetical protein
MEMVIGIPRFRSDRATEIHAAEVTRRRNGGQAAVFTGIIKFAMVDVIECAARAR